MRLELKHGIRRAAPGLCAAVVAAAACSSAAWGQTVKLALHPKAIEAPILHYTLLPRGEDTEPGNAAIHFQNAVAATLSAGRDASKNERMLELVKTSLDELAGEESVDDFRLPPNARTEMLIAARRDSIHWDNSVRTEGAGALLPSVGTLRLLSQGMALEARLAVKDHHWDRATQALQVDYALARDLGQGDTLIESLVGAAIDSIASDQLTLLVQQPDAPNMFWALVTMPRPLVDENRAFSQERTLMYFTFPELKEARAGKYYPGQWQGFVRHMSALAGMIPDVALADMAHLQQLEAAGFGFAMYGPAKTYLAAHGFTEEQADAMPVEEALMRFVSAAYEVIGDEYTAWTLVPYWQTDPVAHSTEQAIQNHPDLRIFPLTAIIPALSRAQYNLVRPERTRAALAAVEAIRDYAAHNNGALPDKLSDIADLPVPVDPVWHKAFDYVHTGDTATLSSEAPHGVNSREALHLELRIEK